MASSSFFSTSSSSATKKKTTKPSFSSSSSSSSKATSLTKRQETVFKKAYELSTLCGIEVCVICYGSDGELKTWPEDREKVKDMARRYSELSETKRRKGRVDLHEFLEKINKDDSKEKKRKVKLGSSHKYPDWDPRFNYYSLEQLTVLIQSLERNLTRIQHRLRAVVESQKQRNMQNTNIVADQEQRMTTASTMNHLQQHPNNISMYMLNHGTGTLSQIPVSASAFNQAQSLAPIPNSLTIYPNSNVGSYSGLLGVQENRMDELLKTNMLTYNNNNNINDFSRQNYQNFKVEDYRGLLELQETGINEFQNTNMYSCNNIDAEDYSGLLGMQETAINGLQNMNMHGYNDNSNTNGLSHQLVQFPAQTSASAFQFGSVKTHY